VNLCHRLILFRKQLYNHRTAADATEQFRAESGVEKVDLKAPPMEASGNPPPTGEMTEHQLVLLNNAALRDLLKQWN
jgi:hypothetical protein